MIKTLTLAATILSVAGIANAQVLKPIQASMIDLGTTHGSAFYVAERDGFHVVATLDAGATLVRFGATLGKGQSATVSVPVAMGDQSVEITFIRVGDSLEVRKSAVPFDAVTASTH